MEGRKVRARSLSQAGGAPLCSHLPVTWPALLWALPGEPWDPLRHRLTRLGSGLSCRAGPTLSASPPPSACPPPASWQRLLSPPRPRPELPPGWSGTVSPGGCPRGCLPQDRAPVPQATPPPAPPPSSLGGMAPTPPHPTPSPWLVLMQPPTSTAVTFAPRLSGSRTTSRNLACPLGPQTQACRGLSQTLVPSYSILSQ